MRTRPQGNEAGSDGHSRYRRIAPLYDLLDLPFEYLRYQRLRRILFAGLSGRVLDAGVGTGRNIPFYPPGATVTGIDLSPAMLARAADRSERLSVPVELLERDLRDTGLADDSFDAVVASFVFMVMPEEHHLSALKELARVCKPNGEVRLLEYTRPTKPLRRLLTRLWEPWVRWAYGASFDREVEPLLPAAGLAVIDSRFVLGDLIKLICARPEAENRDRR